MKIQIKSVYGPLPFEGDFSSLAEAVKQAKPQRKIVRSVLFDCNDDPDVRAMRNHFKNRARQRRRIMRYIQRKRAERRAA